jgi:zinc protease
MTTPLSRDPRRLNYRDLPEGSRLAIQSAPTGASSFALSYIGPAGSGYDKVGQEGIAEMTARLLTAGTRRSDRRDLFRRLDRLGGAVSASTDPERVHLQITGPAGEWPRLLRLFAEILTEPRFEPSELERVHRQMGEAVLRERQNASLRAERDLRHRLFPPGHPYRESGLGTIASLERIRGQDIARFYRRHYTARGSVIVVTHPDPAEEIERSVRSVLELDGTTPEPAPPEIPPMRSPSPGALRIPLAGQSQVEIRIGTIAPSRLSPEYPECALADEVLGGRPILSRLFQVVREQEGLAYHASSSLEAMRWGGYWEVQAGTSASHWRRVLELLQRELRRWRERPITGSELDRIRESVIGEIPLALETTASCHPWAVEIAGHGLPETWLLEVPRRLREITPRTLTRVASAYFESRSSQIVVAGPL